MRRIGVVLVYGLVTALAAAVAASAGSTGGLQQQTIASGSPAAVAVPLRPATSLPFRNGLVSRNDPVGDAQVDPRDNLAAADITRFTIQNDRNGFVIFGVTINQDHLFVGDFVIIFLDLDRNQGTGCNGDEGRLLATGRGEGVQPQFTAEVCRGGSFQTFTHPTYQGTFDAPDRRVLFGISVNGIGVRRFAALAATFWEPDEQNSFTDFAPNYPNEGYLNYTLRQVPCNELIRRPSLKGTYAVGGGSVVLVGLRVVGLPAGASVTVRGAGRSQTVTANGAGAARLRRFSGIRLRPGIAFTVSVRSQGCSVSARFRVNRSGRIR